VFYVERAEPEARQSRAFEEQPGPVLTAPRAYDAGKTDVIAIVPAKDGNSVSIRLADPRDREKLQAYFHSLSVRARYNRFLGAMARVPEPLLEYFIQAARPDRLTMLATVMRDGCETVVGEACYAFDANTTQVEGALSVHDRWQNRGLGRVLLTQLELRAAASGARRLFGDTLRSNEPMIGLARACGYAVTGTPADWRLMRFEKEARIGPPTSGAAPR
jgi:GNAT superfamily N-acetyltransferase